MSVSKAYMCDLAKSVTYLFCYPTNLTNYFKRLMILECLRAVMIMNQSNTE